MSYLATSLKNIDSWDAMIRARGIRARLLILCTAFLIPSVSNASTRIRHGAQGTTCVAGNCSSSIIRLTVLALTPSHSAASSIVNI